MMNRLTYRRPDGTADYWDDVAPLDLASRLAAYEDTELTPEEFAESCNWTLEMNKKLKPYMDAEQPVGNKRSRHADLCYCIKCNRTFTEPGIVGIVHSPPEDAYPGDPVCPYCGDPDYFDNAEEALIEMSEIIAKLREEAKKGRQK